MWKYLYFIYLIRRFKSVSYGTFKNRNSSREGSYPIVIFVIQHTCIMWHLIDSKYYLHGIKRTDGEVSGTPLQYSCLENSMDGGAWWAAVHGVAKSWTRLSNLTFTFHFHALEKEMATHSRILAWRIPGMGEPGGLPSMGSHKVGHD